MTAHIGVDAVTGLTHLMVATSANVADVTMAGTGFEDDKRIYGDAGYLGMEKYLGEDKKSPDARCCAAVRRSATKKIEDSRKKTLLLA